LREIREE
jgi:hypothetical protein